jgi:AraC-like DNA-binding protein
LVEVVSLMEANIEEAIELDELASYVGLSRRQLERLFQKYLQCTPSKYYMKLRLFRARQLLKQTSMSIIDVAAACGFVSTPHFSKCYREHLGIPPREERRGIISAEAGELVEPAVASVFTELENSLFPSVIKRTSECSSRALKEAKFEPTYGSVVI